MYLNDTHHIASSPAKAYFSSIHVKNICMLGGNTLHNISHWGRVTHNTCVGKLNHHWFRKWLVAWTAPSHYLNQCWNIVYWTLRNKHLWIFDRNSNIFIQEGALQNVACEMVSILSRPQCDTWCSKYQYIYRAGYRCSDHSTSIRLWNYYPQLQAKISSAFPWTRYSYFASVFFILSPIRHQAIT